MPLAQKANKGYYTTYTDPNHNTTRQVLYRILAEYTETNNNIYTLTKSISIRLDKLVFG